jgi:hypothetical protein
MQGTKRLEHTRSPAREMPSVGSSPRYAFCTLLRTYAWHRLWLPFTLPKGRQAAGGKCRYCADHTSTVTSDRTIRVMQDLIHRKKRM